MDSPCINVGHCMNVGLRAKALWLVLVFHFMTLRYDCSSYIWYDTRC